MTTSRARLVHLVTAAVAVFALVLQTVLVVTGASVLAETAVPPLATRLGRLVSYFTIQSNLLVAVTAVQLARDPLRDGRWWRPVRLAAVVGITVTGLVHFFLLRPLLDLQGPNALADVLLHLVVPLLGVGGWLLAGPRPRWSSRDAAVALLWPVLWLVWTVAVGALSGWVPYPFLDVEAEGGPAVALTCVGVTVLFLLLIAALLALDRRLPSVPVRRSAPRPRARVATAE